MYLIILKPFPSKIKTRLLNEQVGDRGFDVVIDDLFPPQAGNLVGLGGDECLGVGAGTVGRATEVSVDDFLCIDPRGFVDDILEIKVHCLVLDRDGRRGQRIGNGGV